MTASNRTLEWAEVHLDFGYCPVPTIAGTKGACIPWKPWQTQRPTLADLVSWWPDGIRRNIALVCGVFHGLVVVDADDEEAVRFSRLQFAPTPYRVRTRRGLHFYYRHPGEGIHIQTKAKVYGPDGPAVDVRGDGGMATALGSVHQSGHIYRLDEGGDMLSALD
ncbi:MAG TPA: bifunctional DNA primase/polymerase, partial [Holophaga sp.]|nr:bifunctional DNA primase/polymerase [Holophaga sp.]